MAHTLHDACITKHLQSFFHIICSITALHLTIHKLSTDLQDDALQGVTKQYRVNFVSIFGEVIIIGLLDVLLFCLTLVIILCLNPSLDTLWHATYHKVCAILLNQIIMKCSKQRMSIIGILLFRQESILTLRHKKFVKGHRIHEKGTNTPHPK